MSFLTKRQLPLLALFVMLPGISHCQFLDSFDGDTIDGWVPMTGDGAVALEFVPMDGYARIEVDARQDRHNVWWSTIRRDITEAIDVDKLAQPGYELRVEARVRPSDAPRRVNFMLNTSRTTDYHRFLREYDIADTSDWHRISMTTENFDVLPGDRVYVQLSATDWGLGKYHLDVDYYRADVVNAREVGPDLGEPLIYHPPVPDPETFNTHLKATHDSVISAAFPKVNFGGWQVREAQGVAPVLTVDAALSAILRWDFGPLRGARAAGPGLLELTTQSVAKGGDYSAYYGEDLGIEFGKVRVIEILSGDPDWELHEVTYDSFTQGADLSEVINGQMVYDFDVTLWPGGKNLISISRPVLQRLLDGKSKGLILQPLGVISATFYASEDGKEKGPKLHFSLAE